MAYHHFSITFCICFVSIILSGSLQRYFLANQFLQSFIIHLYRMLAPCAAAANIDEGPLGELIRSSNLASPSCDSVRIHRSMAVGSRLGEKANDQPMDTDPTVDQPESTFTSFAVTDPKCTVRHIPSDPDYTSGRLSSDLKVQWTTPRGQEDALGAALIDAVGGLEPVEQLAESDAQQPRPFYKWVKTLNRRRIARRHLRRLGTSDQTRSDTSNGGTRSSISRRNSSSISSLAYVSAIRDASISCASTSLAPSSRKFQSRSSKRLSKTDRSSRTSFSARQSEDERPSAQVDLATLERANHRRRILEELIETEEGYIGDIKFLIKVGGYRNASSCLDVRALDH